MIHKTDHTIIIFIETPQTTASGYPTGQMRHVPWSHTDDAAIAIELAEDAQRYIETDMNPSARVVFDGNISDNQLYAYRRLERHRRTERLY